MDEAYEAIAKLASFYPPLTEAIRAHERWMAPDSPLSTIAAGDVATALAAHLDEIDDEALKSIFGFCETVMATGAPNVRDVMATGFLEALQHRSDRSILSFARFGDALGPESRAYCLAWDAFTGTVTPGLRPEA